MSLGSDCDTDLLLLENQAPQVVTVTVKLSESRDGKYLTSDHKGSRTGRVGDPRLLLHYRRLYSSGHQSHILMVHYLYPHQ